MGVPGEFENPDAFVQVGLFGRLVAVDVLLQASLLGAPFFGHLVEERTADLAIQLVDVHGVDALAEPPVLGLKPLDSRLVLPALVCMAGVECLPHPVQHLVIEVQPTEHGYELLFENFLTHILAAAGGGLAPAFVRIAGAMVVNVLLFLNFADHRAAALGAGNHSRKGEVVRHASVFARVPAIQYALYTLPSFDRYYWLVLALIELAVPLKPA